MSTWNRERMISWLKAHRGKRIRLGQRGSAVAVVGRSQGVEELDACSMEFMESMLDVGVPDVEVALSYHLEGVGLHVVAYRPGTREAVLSLPLHLPYAEVALSEADAARPKRDEPAPPQPDERKEEEYSPYELLFPRSG